MQDVARLSTGNALTFPGSGEGCTGRPSRRIQKRLVAPAPAPQTPNGGSTARSASTDSRVCGARMRTARVSPRPPRHCPGPPESSRSAVASTRTG